MVLIAKIFNQIKNQRSVLILLHKKVRFVFLGTNLTYGGHDMRSNERMR